MGAKSLWGLWAPDLLQYYDHIHQNKKHTCHLRMWDWFHIIHQILISSHFIQSNTFRAERWNIWILCFRCPSGHSSVLVQATSHNLNKCWLSTWCRDPLGYGPSQWMMTLQGNAVPHWPIPHPEMIPDGVTGPQWVKEWFHHLPAF